MMNDGPTFILLAGALQPAWVWHRLLPLLKNAGYNAVAPDLPGMGENQSVEVEDVTLDLWTDFVVQQIRFAGTPVILVGHSRAGVIVGEAAERVPELVIAIVYVSGIAVPPGRTALDVMALDPNAPSPPTTAGGKAFYLPPEIVIPLMYHRCAPQDAEQVASRLRPEPFAPITTPTSVTADRWGRIPKTYIETTDDRTLSLERQHIIQLDSGCECVIQIDSDHSPFLSAPDDLGNALVAIAGCLAKIPLA